jgi:hypothetical protein
MPGKRKSKTDDEKGETVKVFMTHNLIKRCSDVKQRSFWAEKYDSEFRGYLIKIGLEKYEKNILPVENEDVLSDCPLCDSKKNRSDTAV